MTEISLPTEGINFHLKFCIISAISIFAGLIYFSSLLHIMENVSEPQKQFTVLPHSSVEEQNLISVNKFLVLSIATMGFYTFWWSYKTWRFFHQKDQLDISPALRAIFGIFFLISLYKRILHYASEKGYQEHYSPVLLFVFGLAFDLLGLLPAPFWLLSNIGILFTLPAFKALLHAMQHATEYRTVSESGYSTRQKVLLGIGGLIWIVCLASME